MDSHEYRVMLRERCYKRCMKKHGFQPVCAYSPNFPKPTHHMGSVQASGGRRAGGAGGLVEISREAPSRAALWPCRLLLASCQRPTPSANSPPAS